MIIFTVPSYLGHRHLIATRNLKMSVILWTGVWGSQSLFPILMGKQVWNGQVQMCMFTDMHSPLELLMALVILTMSRGLWSSLSQLWSQDHTFDKAENGPSPGASDSLSSKILKQKVQRKWKAIEYSPALPYVPHISYGQRQGEEFSE